MEFSRQEYWSGLPFPSPGDLPNPGIQSGSPMSQADSSPSEPPGKPLEKIYLSLFFFYIKANNSPLKMEAYRNKSTTVVMRIG